MANVQRDGGMIPVGHLTNGQYDGRFNRYYVPATNANAIFVGDVVKGLANGDSKGVPAVVAAGVADPPRGVVVGFELNRPGDVLEHPGYIPALTEAYVHVADDPFVIYEVEEDSVGGALAVTDISKTCNLVHTAGSTTTGVSKHKVDSSNAGTGVIWRLLGLAQREDNEVGASAKWRVLCNDHELNNLS